MVVGAVAEAVGDSRSHGLCRGSLTGDVRLGPFIVVREVKNGTVPTAIRLRDRHDHDSQIGHVRKMFAQFLTERSQLRRQHDCGWVRSWIIGVPAAFAFTNGRDDYGMSMFYGGMCLLIAGFGLRGVTTGYNL